MRGGGTTPAPRFLGCDFLGRNAVCEPAKTFGAKVASILPSWPDWDGVAADFLHNFFPGHVRVIEKFFTESHRHFEIYGVGVYAIFRLSNNNFLYNAAGEVEGRQRRPDFLLHKVIPFPVEVHQSRAVLQVPETGLDSPAAMVNLFQIVDGKCSGK